jgi:hypothetical protein
MILFRRIGLLLLACLLASCSGFKPQPMLSKVLTFSASDFGPESMAAPLLGPGSAGKQVLVVHRVQPQLSANSIQVLAAQAIKHLNRCVTDTPRDAAHAELRARLIRTRTIILDFYNQRRIAFNSVPPYTGRGYMARQMMMPGIGTSR